LCWWRTVVDVVVVNGNGVRASKFQFQFFSGKKHKKRASAQMIPTSVSTLSIVVSTSAF
jgi:hypothetical protein